MEEFFWYRVKMAAERWNTLRPLFSRITLEASFIIPQRPCFSPSPPRHSRMSSLRFSSACRSSLRSLKGKTHGSHLTRLVYRKHEDENGNILLVSKCPTLSNLIFFRRWFFNSNNLLSVSKLYSACKVFKIYVKFSSFLFSSFFSW